MNKREIEKLRGAARALSKKRLVLTEEDKGLLSQFFAARVGSRDYDRAVNATPRKLATIAFGEAVDALIVWKREVGKLDARPLAVVDAVEGGVE